MPKAQLIVMEGSPVVRALEDAWTTIRHHPELPRGFIVVGARSGTKQPLRHGHRATMRWERDNQRLIVDGDGLHRGAVVVDMKINGPRQISYTNDLTDPPNHEEPAFGRGGLRCDRP